ncbi:aldo/keto reductase family protein [Micromonospora arida]|uniref:Aldo/keto reductase n=1 Tax=Micromonospora arida TaxID=2203715 RepID=A0A3N9XKX2_9ACTN|nr:aldo/keto reductase family protein [Micromonospora arida]RQX13449.1 aldo/keto reductase [Micromonospora arida]
MEYRQLGRSGLRVSAVAYGNWVTHGNQLDDDAAAACVTAALDAGITTFDTADRYAQGRAEEALGKALSGLRRSSVELCTKVCLPVGPGANDAGLSRKHIIEGCHASLSRLGTDYIDLYQAHRYDDSVPLEETMLAFADLVRQGKVLYVGASEWTAQQLRAGVRLAAELHIPFIANQPQYSMLWRVVEAEVSPACADLGLGQLAWAPLAMGVLTGRYEPGGRPPAGSRATDGFGGPFIARYSSDLLLSRVRQLRPIAEAAGCTMAQLAVAWVLRQPTVAGAIVGASRPEQLAETAKAATVRLDDELMAEIDAVLDEVVERDPAKTARPNDVMPAWRPPPPAG